MDFIGTHTWEELCREWRLRASGRNLLPFLPDQVGNIWNREAQIDIAGVNFMDKTLILGECKWDRHPKDIGTLEKLIDKTDKVLPKDGLLIVLYEGTVIGQTMFHDESNSSSPRPTGVRRMFASFL